MITAEIIAEMAREIVERFQPERVILFGSCARGEIDPDSDVDFLVVMPFSGPRRETAVAILRHLNRFHVPMDVVVLTTWWA